MKCYLVASLLTVLTSSQGILTTLLQSNGKYKYDYATVLFLAEVFKLIVSSVFLWGECTKSPPPKMTTDWKTIMGNLKIVTTGILFRLFLKRKLSNLQWMALVLLAVGTTTSQVKGCGEASCDSLFSTPIQGYMLGMLSACLSVLAGVCTEFLMKTNDDSLYWQNLQLYKFGAIFNMVYSSSMAMLLTMVLSVFLFSFKPTRQLFLGIISCMMSLHMYVAPPNMLVDLPSTVRSYPESCQYSSSGKTDL